MKKEVRPLGSITNLEIKSTIGISYILNEYKVMYSKKIIQALSDLYLEYNTAFTPLVHASKEWKEDYMFCDNSDVYINYFVQIDMLGLTEDFLNSIEALSVYEIKNALKGKIFEIENSLAMYQSMEENFRGNNVASFFRINFRNSLDEIRNKHGKKIALLAVTDQKYVSMKQIEFGKQCDEILNDDEVLALSGFDKFFSPGEFIKHLEENNGESNFLIYVRSSDPIDKLKNPDVIVDHPLLSNDDIRRVIKKYSITLNIDNPEWDKNSHRRINDTKEYLLQMGMGFQCSTLEDIFTSDFLAYLQNGKAYIDYQSSRFTEKFKKYLCLQGLNISEIESGEVMLRFKPMKGTFGCYGHLRGTLSDKRIRKDLKNNLLKRGSYIIQPEMQSPIIVNSENQDEEYMYIDRMYFSFVNGKVTCLGGERTMMPITSTDAAKNRGHGSSTTVYAEILPS